MVKNRGLLTKVVGAALIFLTLVSTVVVVAKACHSQPVAEIPVVATAVHASHGDHHHAPPATQGLANSSLLTEICVGIFYLVLLLGGKFLLKISQDTIKEKVFSLRVGLIAFHRKHSFNLTLSLPQLGIYRI
jgi:predicted cobalt transporter CbtA